MLDILVFFLDDLVARQQYEVLLVDHSIEKTHKTARAAQVGYIKFLAVHLLHISQFNLTIVNKLKFINEIGLHLSVTLNVEAPLCLAQLSSACSLDFPGLVWKVAGAFLSF